MRLFLCNTVKILNKSLSLNSIELLIFYLGQFNWREVGILYFIKDLLPGNFSILSDDQNDDGVLDVYFNILNSSFSINFFSSPKEQDGQTTPSIRNFTFPEKYSLSFCASWD